MPAPVPACPLRRLPLLLAVTCLGSGGLLLLGRQLLELRAPITPRLEAGELRRIRRLDPDPQRRREAALLLSRERGGAEGGDPRRQLDWLKSQGWGNDPLAALVLKRQAEATRTLGDNDGARELWRELLNRFPSEPASADALYALGRDQPDLRQQLLERFPAHPAALAAAQEQGSDGALHLARWGPRWPGAAAALRERCAAKQPPLQAAEREQLAVGLAQLGLVEPAVQCLGNQPGSPDTQLALARALLRDPEEEASAEARLLAIARQAPSSPNAVEAVRLLSEGDSASSLEALRQLPGPLQDSAAVQARLARESKSLDATLAVLRRWPADPASWELQWQRARALALEGNWSASLQLLSEPALADQLPAPLEARRWFWQGLAEWQLGRQQQARRIWQELLERHPGGYYGWRAADRLGQGSLNLGGDGETRLPPTQWTPLNSGVASIDRLWRLGQPLEAWEQWRLHTKGISPTEPSALAVEGRLRRAVGDHWLGLGQLEQASLRLPARQCQLASELERELHTPAYASELEQAAGEAGLSAPLLAAIAKQESRFSPTVRSPVGAVGLLQLMPDTAAEVAGGPVSGAELEQPGRNAELGARYLKQMLSQWQGNPVPAVASYNAGPGAVAGWIDPRLSEQPEVWVEAIPFPETRLYVKKVLGNLWSMAAPRAPVCPPQG
jgi:soluble lytic murein transglycosylase